MKRARRPTTRVRGLGAVAIVVVLVGLAGLAAAIVRMGVATNSTVAQDMLATRAIAREFALVLKRSLLRG